MLKLLAENIPTSNNSPFAPYLPGFTALRLLLLKRNRTPEDNDLANTMLDSYSSYLSSGRNSSDTAWMVARDFMLLHQTTTAQQQNAAIPQNFQAIPQAQPPRAPQVQHQPLQQQLGHVQHPQHAAPLAQHQIHQIQHNQYQQVETMQNPSKQIKLTHQGAIQQPQQNPVAMASVTLAAPAPITGHANNIVGAPAPQDGAPAPAHFPTLQNGQNNLSQNGIAALSHMAQHMTHTNGISTLQNDKSGVPGV